MGIMSPKNKRGHSWPEDDSRATISRSLRKFAIASCMAKLTAGIICLRMFSIVTRVKYHKILANTYFFSFRIRPTLQIRNYQNKERFLAIRMMPRRSQKTNFSSVKTFSN